ncbi:S-adenosyl-L-methionine-dependent methyltransferase [Phyllosticta citriasiana]|uniref:S-adenosyl-L-methionine-dependent methyltransferase n=1 Tax=Phyllosticta citriasiana TaxID=595635 RepID=A0ABR1KV87_9PEZI
MATLKTVQVPGTTTPQKDPTFRVYTSSQAATYAQNRGSYPKELYEFILRRHSDTGGGFAQLLDVGCGPGNAMRDLAPHFDAATGCDPGHEMIATAAKLGGSTRSGAAISWRVSSAEELWQASGLAEASVDLLTAATAAHWFDMAPFWREAAAIVKPGGSVALFAKTRMYSHPENPAHEAVQQALDDYEKNVIGPHMMPGNWVLRRFFADLELPWQSDPTQMAFDEARFERYKWNDYSLDGPDGKDFFGGSQVVPLERLYDLLSTAAPATRWREAHPEDTETERDCVRALTTRLKEISGRDELRLTQGLAFLLFKRAAN